MVFVVTEAVFLLFLVFAFSRSAADVHKDSKAEAGQRVECFESVLVEDGDSLWTIARRYYSSDYKSMKNYMKRIMALNHMPDEDVHTGAYLVIPYYSRTREDAFVSASTPVP